MSEAVPTWNGFLRADGRKGVRNLVLVIYTVECAQFVAHARLL
jgi:altronate hydrolase